MNRLSSLSILALLAGCSGQQASSWVLVAESVAISEQQFPARGLPRYIPDGSQHAVPSVGFEASDGSFYPILALCQPAPRGGAVEPVRLAGRRLKVFRGVQPVAANNELLGVYEIDDVASELRIAFSIDPDGRLRLSVKDLSSDKSLRLRKISEKTAKHDLESEIQIARTDQERSRFHLGESTHSVHGLAL